MRLKAGFVTPTLENKIRDIVILFINGEVITYLNFTNQIKPRLMLVLLKSEQI